MKEDQEQLVGHLMRVATIVAMKEGLEPGYRIVINDGPDARILYQLCLWNRTDSDAPSYSRDWRKEVRLASSIMLFVGTISLLNVQLKGSKMLSPTVRKRLGGVTETRVCWGLLHNI